MSVAAIEDRHNKNLRDMSALGWLSTSIVHDLRNPLSAICAGAEMLMDADPASTQVKRLATNIHGAARHIREILADFSCMACENRARIEICNLREVITAALQAASVGTERQAVQILLDIPADIELPLARSLMERVFFNLITNSLEAMPAGGEIRIRARKVEKWVLVEVEDNGPGIPRSLRGRLFEPFATAGKKSGLGLGLALSRKAVLDHDGDLWTEPAAGARFVVRLPLELR